MRLDAVSIKNFRCYGEEIRVEFDELTIVAFAIAKASIGQKPPSEPSASASSFALSDRIFASPQFHAYLWF